MSERAKKIALGEVTRDVAIAIAGLHPRRLDEVVEAIEHAVQVQTEWLMEEVCGSCGGTGLGSNECVCVNPQPLTRAETIKRYGRGFGT